jgi:hypothetical protein
MIIVFLKRPVTCHGRQVKCQSYLAIGYANNIYIIINVILTMCLFNASTLHYGCEISMK